MGDDYKTDGNDRSHSMACHTVTYKHTRRYLAASELLGALQKKLVGITTRRDAPSTLTFKPISQRRIVRETGTPVIGSVSPANRRRKGWHLRQS